MKSFKPSIADFDIILYLLLIPVEIFINCNTPYLQWKKQIERSG